MRACTARRPTSCSSRRRGGGPAWLACRGRGRWNGEHLAVTYVHEGRGWKGGLRPTAPAKPAGKSTDPARKPRSRARRLLGAFVQTVVFLALLAALVVAILGVALIADVGNLREMAEDLPKPLPHLVKDYLEWVRSMRG